MAASWRAAGGATWRFGTWRATGHVLLVQALVRRLPDPAALDDLVDMTGLGWILVRPASEWKDTERRRMALEALGRHARTLAMHQVDDFVLVRLDATSHHPEWFQSLALGFRPGYTALGTRLAALLRGLPGVGVSVEGPRTVSAGSSFAGTLTIENRSAVGLPAALPGRREDSFTVRVAVGWRSEHDDDRLPSPPRVDLLRDVPPSSRLVQEFHLTAPALPGNYVLRVTLEQVHGPDLTGADNPGEARITVTDR